MQRLSRAREGAHCRIDGAGVQGGLGRDSFREFASTLIRCLRLMGIKCVELNNHENAERTLSEFGLWSSRPVQNDLPKIPQNSRGLSANNIQISTGRLTFSNSQDHWPLASGLWPGLGGAREA